MDRLGLRLLLMLLVLLLCGAASAEVASGVVSVRETYDVKPGTTLEVSNVRVSEKDGKITVEVLEETPTVNPVDNPDWGLYAVLDKKLDEKRDDTIIVTNLGKDGKPVSYSYYRYLNKVGEAK